MHMFVLQDPLFVPQLMMHVGPAALADWILHVGGLATFSTLNTAGACGGSWAGGGDGSREGCKLVMDGLRMRKLGTIICPAKQIAASIEVRHLI